MTFPDVILASRFPSEKAKYKTSQCTRNLLGMYSQCTRTSTFRVHWDVLYFAFSLEFDVLYNTCCVIAWKLNRIAKRMRFCFATMLGLSLDIILSK
jgi:hypothetical protein